MRLYPEVCSLAGAQRERDRESSTKSIQIKLNEQTRVPFRTTLTKPPPLAVVVDFEEVLKELKASGLKT